MNGLNVLQVFKQFVVFGIIGFLTGYLFGISVAAGIGFSLVIALCTPAIIMILVVTNSVLNALNPFIFMPVIMRIGWPYLLMYLFLTFLFAAPAALFSNLPLELVHPRGAVFLSLCLPQFYALISYHLMGYILLQYHEELGYRVDYDFFMNNRGGKKCRKRKTKTPEEELKIGLTILVKNGKYQEALQRLQPFVRRENPDLDLSEKFFQLLKMAGETEVAAKYGVRHLDLLVKNKKKQQAVALFPEVKGGNSTPPSAESVYSVASWYKERNEFQKALEAFALFTKHHKQDSRLPEVYFESAKLMHEWKNNSTKARQILQAVINRFPDHKLIPDAREYLALIGQQP